MEFKDEKSMIEALEINETVRDSKLLLYITQFETTFNGLKALKTTKSFKGMGYQITSPFDMWGHILQRPRNLSSRFDLQKYNFIFG